MSILGTQRTMGSARISAGSMEYGEWGSNDSCIPRSEHLGIAQNLVEGALYCSFGLVHVELVHSLEGCYRWESCRYTLPGRYPCSTSLHKKDTASNIANQKDFISQELPFCGKTRRMRPIIIYAIDGRSTSAIRIGHSLPTQSLLGHDTQALLGGWWLIRRVGRLGGVGFDGGLQGLGYFAGDVVLDHEQVVKRAIVGF